MGSRDRDRMRGPARGRGHAATGKLWAGPVPLAAAVLAAGLFLPPRFGRAQGNPAYLLRQMQSRIASLNAEVQRQQTMIQQMGKYRSADSNQLQQLQSAVYAAAAAGDPLARAVRGSNAMLTVQMLTAQFQAHSRPGAAGSADTEGADLSGARLRDALLRAVKLPNANLSGADLSGADLTHATLTGDKLRGAKLQGTNLTSADLTKADLTGALYDAKTRWPTGFDPAQHGALLVH